MNLYIEDEPEGSTSDVYEPEGSTSDTDEEVRLSNMRASVVRCLHTASRDEDWRRTSVFYTNVVHKRKNYKVMIDGDSCVNIIAKTVIHNMGLQAEPHPQPYNMAWVNKTAQAITQRCQVPINTSNYQDRVWCDILDMDVAHILLDMPC